MDMNDVGSALSSALGAVGGVLDTPRRLVYAGLVNPAYHALGGDPNRQIGHFADLLGAGGMDPESWLTKGLGMAGDAATDPLTYLGAFGGEALANEGFRAADGALQAGRDAGGGAQLRNLLSPVTRFKDVAPAAADALPEGFDRAAGVVGAGGADGAGTTARVVGGRQYLPGQVEGKFDAAMATQEQALQSLAEGGHAAGGLQGMYSPTANATLTPAGASPLTQRHELIHAAINNAARTGETRGLPAVMRVPADLLASSGFDHTTLGGGLGTIGDELAAQSLENRGAANQLRGAADFLFNPKVNNAYSTLYGASGVNPAALGAYRAMRYAPAAAGAGAGAGAGLLGDALGGP